MIFVNVLDDQNVFDDASCSFGDFHETLIIVEECLGFALSLTCGSLVSILLYFAYLVVSLDYTFIFYSGVVRFFSMRRRTQA